MCHLELIKQLTVRYNTSEVCGSGCLGGLIVMPSDPSPVLPLSPPGLAGQSEKCIISILFVFYPIYRVLSIIFIRVLSMPIGLVSFSHSP